MIRQFGTWGRFLLYPPLCAWIAAAARADVTPAALFRDHAVLQSGKEIPVWGRADPGEKVVVAFHGQSAPAVAGPDGRWSVRLAAAAASSEPADLVVTGRNTVAVHDVLVGEVWLCSGQSNMEFVVGGPKTGPLSVYGVENAGQEIAAAHFPLIRHFKVAHRIAEAPLSDTAGEWVVCSPDTVSNFTAVGYFFAREMQRRLGVPVGLINASYASSPIEAWMNAADPEHPQSRGPLFNGMVNPLAPYALRGVLWYQGESNAGHPEEYHALFASLIAGWRACFGQGDIPFYFVQLAGFRGGMPPDADNWAYLREAQAQALSLPQTGMAVTIDIGDPADIHPRKKQEVGRRLALIAKANVYGIDGDWSGPMFAGAARVGGALRVTFTHAETGLIARDKPVQSLEVAGADRRFHPASGRIAGEILVVSSPLVPEPVAVRYAWRNAPEANLCNGAGLPAAPFRSDRW